MNDIIKIINPNPTSLVKRLPHLARHPFLLLVAVLLVFLFLNSCSNTVSIYGYTLGWNSNHAYVVRVKGTWDRTSFYLDGSRDEIADLGKIPVSGFQMRKQAELFARTRATYIFQEEIEQYFNNLDQYQDEDIPNDIPFEETEALVDEIAETTEDDVQADNTQENNIQENNIQENSVQRGRIIASNQNVTVYAPGAPENVPNTPAPAPIPEDTTFAELVAQGPDNYIRKTINFQQVYEKVSLKVTLLERIFDEVNDVEVIYLFSGRNLKDELAKAFIVPQGEIEQQK